LYRPLLLSFQMIALRKRFLCALACLVLFDSIGFAAGVSRFEFAEVHMGTQFKIILYSTNEKVAQRAAQKAFHRIARLDAIMSDYKETSELNRFCRKGAKKPVTISPDLFRVLNESQKLAIRSDGAFDVTIGTIVRLWRRARRTNEMPDKERISRALALTGYKKLHLDAKTRTAWLDQDGILLDLGGIAKGFAADEAMRVLKQQGICSALVAAGGDIVVSDAPPQKSGWLVAIALPQTKSVSSNQTNDSMRLNSSPLPVPNDSGAQSTDKAQTTNLLLTNAAVSTSGDAEQFVELDGVRYSHIVDPKTGIGITGQSSVTIVARRGTDSDGLATAVSVLGAERGLRLINATPNTAALMIKKLERNFEFIESKRWKDVPKSSKVAAQK
jgi:thiamine biosynthesis lipoprotein